MPASNAEQGLHVGKNLLLCARSPGLHERIVRIANPAPREITSVIRICPPGHADLVPVIDFWNTSQREGQSKRQLLLCRRTAFLAGEPRYVMIRKERHQPLGMQI